VSKPRARTIQQRFGFQDMDLKSPKHDEMMIWLDENIVEVISSLISYSPTWPNELELKTNLKTKAKKHINHISSRRKQYESYLAMPELHPSSKMDYELAYTEYSNREKNFLAWFESLNLGQTPSKPPLEQIISTSWEQPIGTGRDNKYIVGFIDLVAWIKVPRLTLINLDAEKDIEWEDIAWHIADYPDRIITFNFEIKSSIPSVGELLRQIRMYQEYTNGHFIVVSPDTRFKSVIEKQGIKFIDYTS